MKISKILFITLLIASVTLPSIGEAAVSRQSIKKPSRGNYEMIGNEAATRRNQFSSKPAKQAKNKTFKNVSTPFTFVYPDSWKATGDKTSASLAPVFDGYSLKTKRNSLIAMIVEPIAAKRNYSMTDLNAHVRSRVQLASDQPLGDWYVPSYGFIGSGTTMLLGHPALTYEYTGEVGSEKYRFKRITTSFDKQLITAYFLSKPETFEQDLLVFEDVLKTLKIEKKGATSSASS
jgi:hypothetical protein